MNLLSDNRKARHDYFIEDRYEAGLVLEGWEVKAIRAGRASLKEAYVVVKGGEIWLIGSHMAPETTVSSHIKPQPTRTRKLLLRASEIKKMVGLVARAGYTLVPLNLHIKSGRIKLEVGLAKGKKQHDKRQSIKERDIKREQAQQAKQPALARTKSRRSDE